MGKKPRKGSRKRQGRGAPDASNATAHTLPTSKGAPLPDTLQRLSTHSGRMGLLAECYDEFCDPGVGENRQRALAAALRVIKLAREDANEHQELEHLRELAAQLQADRDERAAMESGGEYAHQDAELPPIGSGDRH